MSTRHHRLAAAALSALAVGALFNAPMAFADPGDPYSVDGANQEAQNKALINPDADTQLQIHKYLGSESDEYANDGTEQTITDRDPLSGVVFDVYLVSPVDLTTNAGWTAATALSGRAVSDAEIAAAQFSADGATYTLTKVDSVTTNSSGTAVFDGEVGLYLVVENLADSGTITNLTTNETVEKSAITGAASFLVTLPMTNPTDTSRWMYDVNVYPKNQADAATKSVSDKGTVSTDGDNVGEHLIEFTIDSSITDGSEPLGAYGVYDDLHESLTLVGATVELSNGDTLTAGADYEIYTDESDFRTPGSDVGTSYSSGDEVAGGPVVSIVMTEAGLTKLEQDRSLSVVTTLTVTLGELDADGVIENQATFIPSESWFDQHPSSPGNPPGVPTNEVESKYGNIVVNKQDPTDPSQDMAGAEFSIYADPTPGDGICSATDVTGVPINSAAITTGNSLTFTGLQASNWYDGANVAQEAEWLSYCLVETKAPTGYNLDATPHYLTIDWNTATPTAAAYVSEVVNNERSNLANQLPLTGGDGVAAMSILGLGLVGGGLAYYAATSRKRKEQQ